MERKVAGSGGEGRKHYKLAESRVDDLVEGWKERLRRALGYSVLDSWVPCLLTATCCSWFHFGRLFFREQTLKIVVYLLPNPV